MYSNEIKFVRIEQRIMPPRKWKYDMGCVSDEEKQYIDDWYDRVKEYDLVYFKFKIVRGLINSLNWRMKWCSAIRHLTAVICPDDVSSLDIKLDKKFTLRFRVYKNNCNRYVIIGIIVKDIFEVTLEQSKYISSYALEHIENNKKIINDIIYVNKLLRSGKLAKLKYCIFMNPFAS